VITAAGGGPGGRSAGDRFARLCAATATRLPFGLSRVVAPSFLGFAVINGGTFGVDLLVLTALREWLGWPVTAAISGGYAVAFALSFLLNRTLNFRAHGHLGRQGLLYALVVAVNAGVLLGVGGGLAALGVEYHLARLVAGAVEGAFMYCAMRWVVFARRPQPSATASPTRTGPPSSTSA
jgi:putative flippase GtrA